MHRRVADFVRQLVLDDVWPEAQYLAKDRAGSGAEAMARDCVGLVAHPAPRRGDGVL